MARPEEMYQCQTVDSGYVYDPDKGDKRRKIAAGTAFKGSFKNKFVIMRCKIQHGVD